MIEQGRRGNPGAVDHLALYTHGGFQLDHPRTQPGDLFRLGCKAFGGIGHGFAGRFGLKVRFEFVCQVVGEVTVATTANATRNSGKYLRIIRMRVFLDLVRGSDCVKPVCLGAVYQSMGDWLPRVIKKGTTP